MLPRYAPWLILAIAIVVLPSIHYSAADEAGKGGAKPEASPKADTVKVEKGPLTSAVTLKGTTQGVDATEIAVKLRAWAGPMIVQTAIEHGTSVKAGDVLVKFDTEKLDSAISEAKNEHMVAQTAILEAEAELPILQKQAPLDLAAAQRDLKYANEDFERFRDVDRKALLQANEFMLKSVAFALDSARENLKQLQKMYRDKDLTEETEQIILKRYKFMVEMGEFESGVAKIESERFLKDTLPRREQAVKDAVAKAELAFAKARDVNPLTLKQKQSALSKLRFEETKAREHLANLEKDREALTVKAPSNGLAYYGRNVRGQWNIPQAGQGHALLPGGNLNSGDVFMTLLPAGKIVVMADVEEKELPGLTPGLAGRITPTAFPDEKLSAKLKSVALAPLNGKFEILIDLEGKPMPSLVPGMACSIRFVTARKPNALTVPSSAVFEEHAEDTHYVYLCAPSGKHDKRTVKVGLTSGDRTEILDGLTEGNEILASKP